MKICALCGKPAECEHHLIFGFGLRELADEDKLIIPLCNKCHNIGIASNKIHDNVAAEKLSKMLGQALWENEYLAQYAPEYELKYDARVKFRERYGRSYL